MRGDGRVDVTMSFRDNGRGPDIKEQARLTADGTVSAPDVPGIGADPNEDVLAEHRIA